MTNPHVEFALAHPVWDDPEEQLSFKHVWFHERNVSIGLTCNAGMEETFDLGGRPLWQVSICYWRNGRPLGVDRWSPTMLEKAKALRDEVTFGLGTHERWKEERAGLAVVYRKALRVDEVARMGRGG